MSNELEFIQLMKKLYLDTSNAADPIDVGFGTVQSIDPLEIRTDGQRILYEDDVILTKHVTDYEVDIEVSHQTVNDDILNTLHDHPGVPQNSFDSHHYHEYKGRKKIKIYQGLQTGERVVYFKQQGGQQFIILDRLTMPITNGEWLE